MEEYSTWLGQITTHSHFICEVGITQARTFCVNVEAAAWVSHCSVKLAEMIQSPRGSERLASLNLARLWFSFFNLPIIQRVLAYYFKYIYIYLYFRTRLALKVPYYSHFHIYIFIFLTRSHSAFEMKWKSLLALNLENFFNWFLHVSCRRPSLLMSIWLVSILKLHFLCVQPPEGRPLSSLRSWCTCPSSVFRSGFS